MTLKNGGVGLDEFRREIDDRLIKRVVGSERVRLKLAVVVNRADRKLLIGRPVRCGVPVVRDRQQSDANTEDDSEGQSHASVSPKHKDREESGNEKPNPG